MDAQVGDAVATDTFAQRAVRTPDERFADVPDFPYEPRYVDVDGLRVAYVDEGAGQPVLFLHGEPTWSYLFRRMMPTFLEAGYRCVAIDYLGFGRSDKPLDLEWYSYKRHTEVCWEVVDRLGLRDVELVGHDWGGSIGLRMSVEHPGSFSRHVLIDAPLFTGRQVMPPQWWEFRNMVEATPDMAIGELVQAGCRTELPADVVAAYDAPFPDATFKAGPRSFPMRVLPLSPELEAGQACWRVMKQWRKQDPPTLILWGEEDLMFPLVVGDWVAGILTAGRREPARRVTGSGHFVPEDRGEDVAALIADWLRS